MNPLQAMAADLRKAVPGITLMMREPFGRPGLWTLDARLSIDSWVVIQWSAEKGFGVSGLGLYHAYGEGPQAVFNKADDALERVLVLLNSMPAAP